MNGKYAYVEVRYFTTGQHVRKMQPHLNSYGYRPHFVVKGKNDYLGVYFLDGEEVNLGETARGTVELFYPEVDYSALVTGADFFIMEGENRVGEGIVLRYYEV
jgi:hypothetical protein